MRKIKFMKANMLKTHCKMTLMKLNMVKPRPKMTRNQIREKHIEKLQL